MWPLKIEKRQCLSQIYIYNKLLLPRKNYNKRISQEAEVTLPFFSTYPFFSNSFSNDIPATKNIVWKSLDISYIPERTSWVLLLIKDIILIFLLWAYCNNKKSPDKNQGFSFQNDTQSVLYVSKKHWMRYYLYAHCA